MKTGSIEWDLLSDGTFRLDGGAMFGVVPKPLWRKRTPADARNRILLGMHPLLIRAGDTRILVDAGVGRKENERFANLYGVGNEIGIVESLAEKGLAPDDIDVVVYTHLHFDHAGGATRREADGVAVPVFPKARHLVEARELADAQAPTARSQASYLLDNWEPIRAAGLLETFEGDMDVAPGVRLKVMKGHVRALVGVEIDSGGERAFYPTDNMPSSVHVPGPWVMGFDLYPLDTLAFKERFLEQVADEAWTVIFEHDPVVGAARLHRADRGWEVETVLDAPSKAIAAAFAEEAAAAVGGAAPG